MKEIGIGLVGAGLRSSVLRHLFPLSANLKLRAVYDPDKARARERAQSVGFPEADIAENEDEVICRSDVDWVMVFSPNACHANQVVKAFGAGKNVFSEKPMVTTLEDCRRVIAAHKSAGTKFVTGFVLRHSPVYRKVKEILAAGTLGQIIAVEADENLSVDLGSYIMRNWRRLRANAGPYILEKCCHDLDLLNWFIGSLPVKTASFGGLNFYLPQNEYIRQANCDAEGHGVFDQIPDSHAEVSPFTCDKDINDNNVIILEYANGVRATFQSIMSNALPDRRMYIAGSEGTLVLSHNKISVKRIGDDATSFYDLDISDGHSGGDPVIMGDLFKVMSDKGEPEASGREGMESAVVALAIDRAQQTGQVVDIRPLWKEMDYEISK